MKNNDSLVLNELNGAAGALRPSVQVEQALAEIKENYQSSPLAKIPFTEIAALGGSFASVVETMATPAAEGLYRCVFPKGVTGTLAMAKDGTGALGTIMNDGIVGQARWIPVDKAIGPACLKAALVAVAVLAVVKQIKDIKDGHEAFVESVFNVNPPKCPADQKKSFEALLTTSLGEECSMDVVQTVHNEIRERIEMHKEAKVAEPLMISKEDVKTVLSQCGVPEANVAKFSVDYDEAFGFEADLHPKNVIDNKKFEIKTPDVIIKVAPDRSDLIETRVIGGVKYIMICADEAVEVNGVNIHIADKEPANV